MSRLLKKLSQKSLRKRFSSNNESTPSLVEPPVPKRTMSEPPPPMPTRTISSDKSLVVSPLSPSASLGALTTTDASKDDSAIDLTEAWAVANTAPKVSKADKVLQVLGASGGL